MYSVIHPTRQNFAHSVFSLHSFTQMACTHLKTIYDNVNPLHQMLYMAFRIKDLVTHNFCLWGTQGHVWDSMASILPRSAVVLYLGRPDKALRSWHYVSWVGRTSRSHQMKRGYVVSRQVWQKLFMSSYLYNRPLNINQNFKYLSLCSNKPEPVSLKKKKKSHLIDN